MPIHRIPTTPLIHVVDEDWKFSIPDDFILIQDTREQKPLFDPASLPPNLTVINKALKDGDYSIKGFEHLFAIERKQMSDFYSYITSERTKTLNKMRRFRGIKESGGWVGLVIEETELSLFQGHQFSRVTKEHVRGSITSFEIRYGVHVYYSDSRTQIARWCLDRAIKFYNVMREI